MGDVDLNLLNYESHSGTNEFPYTVISTTHSTITMVWPSISDFNEIKKVHNLVNFFL